MKKSLRVHVNSNERGESSFFMLEYQLIHAEVRNHQLSIAIVITDSGKNYQQKVLWNRVFKLSEGITQIQIKVSHRLFINCKG